MTSNERLCLKCSCLKIQEHNEGVAYFVQIYDYLEIHIVNLKQRSLAEIHFEPLRGKLIRV